MDGSKIKERFDFIIFGASGFTGKYVVEEVARVAEKDASVTWAVAGRNMEKLQQVLSSATTATGKELENTPIVIADVSNHQSMIAMCEQAKVLLNCVGPYRFHGDQVVRACIEAKASHIDISGEPSFLEKTQLLYSVKARENGVYIVGSCGFDSIPADMGVDFTKKKFDGDLNSIECYIDYSTTDSSGISANVTTYECAVHGFANQSELPTIRKTLFPTALPKANHKIQKRSVIFFSEDVNKWCVPFPGSDRSVVLRSQRYNLDVRKERPVQFVPYFCRPSLFSTIVMAMFGILFAIFAKFSLTRSLLLNYPSLFSGGVFTKTGPTKKQIEKASFSATFFGKGYSTKLDDPAAKHDEIPDKKIVTRVIGPEAGYVATPICMVQAALCLIKEKDKLPKEGGVYTPAAAFGNTSLIKRLEDNNIKFEVLDSA